MIEGPVKLSRAPRCIFGREPGRAGKRLFALDTWGCDCGAKTGNRAYTNLAGAPRQPRSLVCRPGAMAIEACGTCPPTNVPRPRCRDGQAVPMVGSQWQDGAIAAAKR